MSFRLIESQSLMMAEEIVSKKLSRLEELLDPDLYEVLDLIVTNLGIYNALELGLASTTCYDRIKFCLQRIPSKVDTQLRKFVQDPKILRSQLGEQNALIGGVFALNFFQLGKHDVPFLDILVEEGDRLDRMLRYIQDEEGYEESGQIKNYMNMPCTIFGNADRPGRNLRVMATATPPIFSILQSSFNTASINFITWNKAYSVFPKATLLRHKCHLLGSLTNDMGPLLRDQMLLEWTNRDISWPDLDNSLQIDKSVRRVGDRSSLIIQLDSCGIQQASIPDVVIEHAQFEIYTKQDRATSVFGTPNRQQQPNKGSFNIRVQPLASPALRYMYVFASRPWHEFVMQRLQRWIWLECLKINADDRPEPFSGDEVPNYLEVSLPLDFQVPMDWDYADDQIVAWYTEWEKSRRMEALVPVNSFSAFGNLAHG